MNLLENCKTFGLYLGKRYLGYDNKFFYLFPSESLFYVKSKDALHSVCMLNSSKKSANYSVDFTKVHYYVIVGNSYRNILLSELTIVASRFPYEELPADLYFNGIKLSKSDIIPLTKEVFERLTHIWFILNYKTCKRYKSAGLYISFLDDMYKYKLDIILYSLDYIYISPMIKLHLYIF